jgi:hypothetical protein
MARYRKEIDQIKQEHIPEKTGELVAGKISSELSSRFYSENQ